MNTILDDRDAKWTLVAAGHESYHSGEWSDPTIESYDAYYQMSQDAEVLITVMAGKEANPEDNAVNVSIASMISSVILPYRGMLLFGAFGGFVIAGTKFKVYEKKEDGKMQLKYERLNEAPNGLREEIMSAGYGYINVYLYMR